MKEFIKSNKVTYNLMSFTAFKTLLIFSMLIEAPRSYQDIIDYFESHDFINEKIAIDTIRVYINSLKRAGCVITKTKRAEGSKFVLVSHPFTLTITSEQIKSLTKTYKILAKTLDISELIILEKLLRKISSNINDTELTETLEKVSLLSGLEIKLLEDIQACCRRKNQIVLSYNSPRSNKTNLEIICDKLGYENNKLYLYGTSIDYQQSTYLLVNRIIGINEIKLRKDENINIETITVRYEIKADYPELQLKDFETLITTNESKTVIEATHSNKFVLIQRILALGCNCTVIEPKQFRSEIVDILKEMRARY